MAKKAKQAEPVEVQEEKVETVTTDAETDPQVEKELSTEIPELTPYQKAMQMVRFSLVTHDPQRAARESEVFVVANDVVGHVSRVIPLHGKEYWHAPRIIVNKIKNTKYAVFPLSNQGNLSGTINIDQPRWVNAFTVTELPPLTQEELQDLAAAQNEAGLYR